MLIRSNARQRLLWVISGVRRAFSKLQGRSPDAPEAPASAGEEGLEEADPSVCPRSAAARRQDDPLKPERVQ